MQQTSFQIPSLYADLSRIWRKSRRKSPIVTPKKTMRMRMRKKMQGTVSRLF
jgi:hypothetical protein